MNKQEKELMARLGQRGGIKRMKMMTLEEKRLLALKGVEAKRTKRLSMLTETMPDGMNSTSETKDAN